MNDNAIYTVEYGTFMHFKRDVEDFENTLNAAAADGWRLHSFAVDTTHVFAVIEKETLR
jgi:Domain of unknown function (DUF4177)